VSAGKDASDLLKAADVRTTPVREATLRALLDAESPLSQRDLAKSPELGRVNKVTLYRTLETLVRAGVAHRVIGADGEWRFCARAGEKGRCAGNHPHFLCLKCGRMECLREQRMPRVDVRDGSVVEGKQLIVYGTCPECGGKGRNATEE
jgi:Fur family ferric uptake transcriptional regulator/Fur family zinc uptake transcriptional regulator